METGERFAMPTVGMAKKTARSAERFFGLIEKGDIDAVIDDMQTRREEIDEANREYDVKNHGVMRRPDRIITDSKGRAQRLEKRWKLPLDLLRYINEVALVFLYGAPVKWTLESESGQVVFKKFLTVAKKARLYSKLREAKRYAGAQTQSAMLFRCYRDGKGEAQVMVRVLADAKGDEIYTRWDEYENLLSVGWGYRVKDGSGATRRHFDLFTDKRIYRCVQGARGWAISEEDNIIGKIPIIVFQQEKEWAGAEYLLERLEHIASKTADTNDYFSDPVAIVSADVIKSMPEKDETGKLLIARGGTDINSAAKYMTWDSAPQSKSEEIKWLTEKIFEVTFTPQITLDNMKGLGVVSGKALKQMMLMGVVKAKKTKERHDEYLDRITGLLLAIIGRVLDVSLRKEAEEAVIGHEWGEPFGDDEAEMVQVLSQAVQTGVMSRETAIEMNPMVKDKEREKERVEEEMETRGDGFGMDME